MACIVVEWNLCHVPFEAMSHKLHSWSKLYRLAKGFFPPRLPFPLLGASTHSLCKDLVSSSLAPSNFQLHYSHFSYHQQDPVTNHRLSRPKQNLESNFLYFTPSILLNLKYLLIAVAAELSRHNMVRILSSCDFWNCWKTVACTHLDKSYRSPTAVIQNRLWQCPTSRCFELANFDLILILLSTFFCNLPAFFTGAALFSFYTLNNVLFILPPGNTVPLSLSSHFLLTILSDFTSFLSAVVVN